MFQIGISVAEYNQGVPLHIGGFMKYWLLFPFSFIFVLPLAFGQTDDYCSSLFKNEFSARLKNMVSKIWSTNVVSSRKGNQLIVKNSKVTFLNFTPDNNALVKFKLTKSNMFQNLIREIPVTELAVKAGNLQGSKVFVTSVSNVFGYLPIAKLTAGVIDGVTSSGKILVFSLDRSSPNPYYYEEPEFIVFKTSLGVNREFKIDDTRARIIGVDGDGQIFVKVFNPRYRAKNSIIIFKSLKDLPLLEGAMKPIDFLNSIFVDQ